MALSYVTITETFDDGSGTPVNGTVVFTPSQPAFAPGTAVSYNNPVTVSIVNGVLGSCKLLATDNTLTFNGLTGFFTWSATVTIAGISQTWQFSLPSSPSTVELYKTMNTPAGGAGGFTNPMTTLGDTLYENATPAAARLPGNTSVVRNFLTQTGTGSVSAAPAWGTIGGGDLPHGDWLRPWQFRPEDYGAKGDGRVFADGVTNGTTTFTSATAGFTSADTGKHIMINGGNGAASAPVLTTITFVNATTVTLGSAAGASATGCAFVYGTDDTAAINSCVSAASTYALANNYLAEILFSDRIYVSTSLTQATSPAVVNAQIPVPYPAQNGLSRKLMIRLRGAGRMSPAQYWESTTPNVQGSAIVSMLTAPSTPDVNFLQQSVIGGPSGSAGFTGTFANTHLTVEDMSIWCPAYTNIKALDMGELSGCHLDGYSSQIFAPANNLSGATAAHPYLSDLPAQGLFQSSIGVGILFPRGGNNDAVTFGSICVEGYEVGIDLLDHATGVRYAGLYCDVIMRCPNVGQSHEVAIQSVSAEVYNGGIRVTGSGGSILRLNVGWDGEAASVVYDISDTSNIATGVVRWYDLDRTAPTVTGASALKVINERLGPGPWAGAPAVPATTVAATNTSWRDAAVTVTGGTVSAVSIDGVAQGYAATGFTVTVPAGHTITLTYSSAPTWKWVLL